MVGPDFFIVGAPKCGTSSLWEHLCAHPGVYRPEIKEPHYFGGDLSRWGRLDSRHRYLDLYRDAAGRLAGDASVFSLYSRYAAREIAEFNREAKIIVMVRDPIEQIVSFHNQLLTDGRHENQRSLERALLLQAERRRGRKIPRMCRRPELLQYIDVARFGEQLARYFDVFPREAICVVVFDDFRDDTAREYRRVCDFLGLPRPRAAPLEVVNPAKGTRSRRLQRWLQPRGSHTARRALSTVLPTSMKVSLRTWLAKANRAPATRDGLSEDTRSWLADVLRPDVSHLGRLVGRNLSHWVSP
jgi:hypothetical protein